MDRTTFTIREAYLQASSFLQQRLIKDHDFVAELLLQHLLGWDRATYFLRWNDPFPRNRQRLWQNMIDRKAAGEPVQYIIGEQEFYGLPFTVNESVLIPRPETELLVENIMFQGKRLWPESTPTLAEIGTGSGAIPITIAVHCPAWKVMSSDISASALEVAEFNAIRNGVHGKVTFYQGDLLDPYIRQEIRVDILVSNPPYIPSDEIAGLQPEVKSYEPLTALDGGEDGLQYYRRILEGLKLLPDIPRLLGFEVGQGQAQTVAEMIKQYRAWDQIEIIRDLAGIDRHIIAYEIAYETK